jgi:hypothetical protein
VIKASADGTNDDESYAEKVFLLPFSLSLCVEKGENEENIAHKLCMNEYIRLSHGIYLGNGIIFIM